MRAEGWVHLKLAKGADAKKLYIVLEGFVLRIFHKEPMGAHDEESMVADEIMDLRYVEKISPTDPYKPPPAGDFCVMDRAVVETILSLPERHIFVRVFGC